MAAKNPTLEQTVARHSPLTIRPLSTGESPRLSRLRGVRAVLFDVYGTLLVSGTGDVGTVAESSPEKAMRTALGAAGADAAGSSMSARALELYREGILQSHEESRAQGIDFPEVDIRRIWAHLIDGLELNAEQIVVTPREVESMAVAYECLANPVAAMPGARMLLQRLRAASIPLSIVSNAQFYTPLILRHALGADLEGLGFPPDRCTWSWELGEAKPSIRLFEHALAPLAKLGIGAANTLYVGNDMLKDVWCASRAGCHTALFAGDRRSLRRREDDRRCRDLEPDIVLTELLQLLDCLPRMV